MNCPSYEFFKEFESKERVKINLKDAEEHLNNFRKNENLNDLANALLCTIQAGKHSIGLMVLVSNIRHLLSSNYPGMI